MRRLVSASNPNFSCSVPILRRRQLHPIHAVSTRIHHAREREPHQRQRAHRRVVDDARRALNARASAKKGNVIRIAAAAVRVFLASLRASSRTHLNADFGLHPLRINSTHCSRVTAAARVPSPRVADDGAAAARGRSTAARRTRASLARPRDAGAPRVDGAPKAIISRSVRA